MRPCAEQRLDREGRRAGLEPVRPELSRVEEKQDVERVVDLLPAAPAVRRLVDTAFLANLAQAGVRTRPLPGRTRRDF